MKPFDMDSRVLIVGLGLLGGSYAKALTKKGIYVSAIDTREESIRYALDNGIINAGSSTVDRALIEDADIIVFALYPKVFVNWIRENQSLFRAYQRRYVERAVYAEQRAPASADGCIH